MSRRAKDGKISITFIIVHSQTGVRYHIEDFDAKLQFRGTVESLLMLVKQVLNSLISSWRVQAHVVRHHMHKDLHEAVGCSNIYYKQLRSP